MAHAASGSIFLLGAALVATLLVKGSEGQSLSRVSCRQASLRATWLECDDTGHYEPAQCRSDTECFCVNPETGVPLDGSKFTRSELNADLDRCEEPTICRKVFCSLHCDNGFAKDGNGCTVCRCATTDDREECRLDPRVVYNGCRRECLTKTAEDCLACNSSCNSTSLQDLDSEELSCATHEDCPNATVCAFRLAGDRRICFNVVTEGERCILDRLEEEAKRESARALLAEGQTLDVVGQITVIPCSRGSTCLRPESSDTNRFDINGICTRFNNSRDSPCEDRQELDATVRCDEFGKFRPLQCNRTHCWCVQRDGRVIAGSLQSDRKPSCADLDGSGVDHCSAMVGGRAYHVRHGDKLVLARGDSCVACICDNGTPDNCRRVDASMCRLRPPVSASNCIFTSTNGTRIRIAHNMHKKIRCNTCLCWDGRLVCTKLACSDDDDQGGNDNNNDADSDAECQRCSLSNPVWPVCGPDGITYKSKCQAIYCRNISQFDLRDGACTSSDGCQEPCEEDQVCIPTRVRCLDADRCPRRKCVDIQQLSCEGSSGAMVCGSDGQNYSSACDLYRERFGRVRLRHQGDCASADCPNEMVCGADLTSYSRRCEAEERGLRVDYSGHCVEPEADENLQEYCGRVRQANHCEDLSACGSRYRVIPSSGCCPICGGTVVVAVDREQLRALSEIEESEDLLTLGGVVRRLAQSNTLKRLLQNSGCTLSGDVSSSGDIELVLQAKMKANATAAKECQNASVMLRDVINRQAVDTAEPDLVYSALTAATVGEPVADASVGSKAKSFQAVTMVSITMAAATSFFVFMY